MSWTVLWASDAEGRALAFSVNAPDVFGRPIEELLGEGWIALLHPDDRDRFLSADFQARQRREAYTLLARIRVGSGTYVQVVDHGLPMIDGNYAGFVQPADRVGLIPLPPTNVVTMQEAADRVGLSVETLYRWAKTANGTTWAVRNGRKWAVDLPALLRYLRRS